MLAALAETDAEGRPVFAGFLGEPARPDEQALEDSALRELLADLDLPGLPEPVEGAFDSWIVRRLAGHELGRHLFALVERGGWYAADGFVAWLERKLDEGQWQGRPQQFGRLTLSEFFEATGQELTVVAADTLAARLLLLNHRTAPDCPVVWAARMSMSIPLVWEEVEWRPEWGPYKAWDAGRERLVAADMRGHTVVDGGMLSNFPIALFLADRADVTAVVGPPRRDHVIGLLIDEAVPVPRRAVGGGEARGVDVGSLRTYQRLMRLVNTAMTAHDNMAISVFARYVVRLPAGGYGTIQFDMTEAERSALVDAGREAMREFLEQQSRVRGVRSGRQEAAADSLQILADDAAGVILQR
jgi:predicted acylesterase/phospholipase RssA